MKDMAKVQVFVYAFNADTDVDTRAVTIAPRTIVPACKKFNLGNSFWTSVDRAFIFHMCIPSYKTARTKPFFDLVTDLDLKD